MILIKTLMAVKKLIAGILKLTGKSIFFILRLFLYRPFIKLYYWLFRFKKSGLHKNSWQKLIRPRFLHAIVFLLTAALVSSNLLSRSNGQFGGSNIDAHKTIISHLVQNEFSSASDDNTLIEETANLGQIILSVKEHYLSFNDAVKNRPWLTNVNENTVAFTADNGAAFINPQLINFNPTSQSTTGNNAGSGNTVSTPNTPTAAAARTEMIKYTVKDGDTISSISQEFNISINTILWANNLTAYSLIRPGDTLDILPVSGVYYTVQSGDTVGGIASQFGVEQDKIFKYNTIRNSGLMIGQKLLIPGGKQLATAPANNNNIASSPSQSSSNSQSTSGDYSGISIIKNIIKPSYSPEVSQSGYHMIWPTLGHTITQYYSWRHTAIDIANRIGTPLFASDSGTVIFAGWSTGYGYNVVINHGGGRETRYAHSSKLLVTVGEHVKQGQTIALMGSTGWSTGPHVHFEVMINGVKYNPLNYVK
jgi:murein DD-endopeptidase MepM/ murein hydrolase activator NlpD